MIQATVALLQAVFLGSATTRDSAAVPPHHSATLSKQRTANFVTHSLIFEELEVVWCQEERLHLRWFESDRAMRGCKRAYLKCAALGTLRSSLRVTTSTMAFWPW